MLLMNVIQDNTMAIPGFEHRTFMCSACHDVERRLVFVKPGEQGADTLPVHASPPVAPASEAEMPAPPVAPFGRWYAAAPKILRRMFARPRIG
jgi:hypothetical protein